jgi:hypothetical protein
MKVMSFHLQINVRQTLRVLQTRAAEYCTLSHQQQERLASFLITKHIGYILDTKLFATSAVHTECLTEKASVVVLHCNYVQNVRYKNTITEILRNLLWGFLFKLLHYGVLRVPNV